MNDPRLAKDILVSKLVTLSPRSHVYEGIQLLLRNRITGAPVVDEGQRYPGVFSEKCCMGILILTAHLAAESSHASVRTQLARDFMAKNLTTVSPHTDVFEAIGYLL
jgi:CBS domain-containing protein